MKKGLIVVILFVANSCFAASSIIIDSTKTVFISTWIEAASKNGCEQEVLVDALIQIDNWMTYPNQNLYYMMILAYEGRIVHSHEAKTLERIQMRIGMGASYENIRALTIYLYNTYGDWERIKWTFINALPIEPYRSTWTEKQRNTIDCLFEAFKEIV